MAGGCRAGHPEGRGHQGWAVAGFILPLHCKKKMGGVGCRCCEIFPKKLKKKKYETHDGITNSVKLVPTGSCFTANDIGSGSLSTSFSTIQSYLAFCLLQWLFHLKPVPFLPTALLGYVPKMPSPFALFAKVALRNGLKHAVGKRTSNPVSKFTELWASIFNGRDSVYYSELGL